MNPAVNAVPRVLVNSALEALTRLMFMLHQARYMAYRLLSKKILIVLALPRRRVFLFWSM
ncbi:hypothetical protein OAL10_10540 [Gammaproteobacteria bacterium]|nr:hypothetical protein [Gammaproteobacteria bacterium]